MGCCDIRRRLPLHVHSNGDALVVVALFHLQHSCQLPLSRLLLLCLLHRSTSCYYYISTGKRVVIAHVVMGKGGEHMHALLLLRVTCVLSEDVGSGVIAQHYYSAYTGIVTVS
jgi:hypothetical protein